MEPEIDSMKPSYPLPTGSARAVCRASRQRAVALVIVLAFLVILATIIIAFFSNVTSESTSATNAAEGVSARMLADSAINLVEAQIRDATRGLDDDDKDILAWASQPGMIRTFEQDGSQKAIYKLYSSDNLVVSGSSFTVDADKPPTDWNTGANVGLYTDLNAPVAFQRKREPDDPPDPPDDPIQDLSYPIVDPRAVDFVEGFALAESPGFKGSEAASPVNNPAPMPVKWLYLLRDGRLRAAVAKDALAVSVPDASDDNPIVGRIAFWTDDETGKVNINTASEGTYWDVPRIFSLEDVGQFGGAGVGVPGFAICQPAQKEFQRYPGHPATTSLSPIFGKLFPVRPVFKNANEAKDLDPYYAIAPRVVAGKNTQEGLGSQGGTAIPNAPLVPDKDRLYASVDELMFTPALSGESRVPNGTASGGTKPELITRKVLDKARFFLTANSNAPETTLFNTPRVAIWPVHADDKPNKRTAFDSLAAFCSTVNKKGYFFTRSSSRSGDEVNIPRNLDLYRYLQNLTAEKIPGFGGGTFLQKYGPGSLGISDRDQILTFIYDYIRSTNLQDRSLKAKPANANDYIDSYTPIFDAANVTGAATNKFKEGAGEVVPSRITGNGQTTQGFGRFYSISEADLLFYGTVGVDGKTTKMRAVFLLEFASPMQGLGGLRSGLKYTVRGLDKLQVRAKGEEAWRALGFPAGGTNFIENSDVQTFHGRSVGGTEGPAQALTRSWTVKKKLENFGQAVKGSYPFYTETDVAIPVRAEAFELQSTATDPEDDITVEILDANPAAATTPIQTIHLSFPSRKGVGEELFKFKIPGVVGKTAHKFNDRVYNSGGTGANVFNLIVAEDTVLGLEPAGIPGSDGTSGDTRMVEALPDVPSTRFRPHKNYGDPTKAKAHSILSATGEPFNGAELGKLVPVATYQNAGIKRHPDVPTHVGNAVTRSDGRPGDWDTGFGDQKDGAYINKPDEGDTRFAGQSRLPYILGNDNQFAPANKTYFSPNRQVPSSLMFGSIPTGVQRFLPWQTLLFHPRPEDPSHPGRTSPPDHLLADLFWMPVIEPYAISQPFSTSGKINMNYQIQPFTYIRRDTGVRAVMKSTKFMALQLVDSTKYKPLDPANTGPRAPNRRVAIDLTQNSSTDPQPPTLAAFDKKFLKNEIFKSATEICEMNLIPKGESADSMAGFWGTRSFTGDNLREKPYVDIYPRLTTKSNTYTVHVRVQALKKVSGTPSNLWVHAQDRVTSEYRGSSIVERYIDVNDPDLPDFATIKLDDEKASIDQYYKMRVVSTKRFAP